MNLLLALLPSLLAIWMHLVVSPLQERLLDSRLREFLGSENLADKVAIVEAIAKDRVLQVGFMASVTGYFACVISLIYGQSSSGLDITVAVIGLLGLPMGLDIFLRAPGFHASTLLSRRLARSPWRGTTRLGFYNFFLLLGDLSLALVILSTAASD